MPVSESPPGTAETAVYEPPTFTRLGTLAELTLGLDSSSSEDGAFGFAGDVGSGL